MTVASTEIWLVNRQALVTTGDTLVMESWYKKNSSASFLLKLKDNFVMIRKANTRWKKSSEMLLHGKGKHRKEKNCLGKNS